jgi:hypothetical protein
MKSNTVKQLVLGAFAAVILMSGVFSTTAEAQTRGFRRHRPVIVYRPYYRYYSPFYDPFYSPFYDPFWGSSYRTVDPVAYQQEQGYSKGRSKGKDDAKKGLAANATGHKDYLKSDSLHYREAFVKGYREGYNDKLADIRKDMREKHGD